MGLVVLSSVFLVGDSGCAARTATACSGRVFLENRPAPALIGRELRDDRTIDGLEPRGRPKVVNFWASWCGPCREEGPMLAEAWRELSPTVDFVGVTIRDERVAASAFVDEFGLGYPHIFDKEATLAAAWAVSSPPATFVVSPDGHLLGRFVGTLTGEDLDCMLGLLL